MKKVIALDLDGAVFDSENLYRCYSEIYDVDIMKGNNIIDNSERQLQKRYNWPKGEDKKLYESCYRDVCMNANVMPGADIV